MKKHLNKNINGILSRRCSVCKKWLPATIESFNYRDVAKKQFNCICKDCARAYKHDYYKKNQRKMAKKNKQYRETHKKQIALMKTQYRINNIEKVRERDLLYQKKNKNKIAIQKREYRIKNKEKSAAHRKEYRTKNKKQLAERKKIHGNMQALFATYAKHLTVEEKPIQDKNGFLCVKCAYCGKYFIPINRKVSTRIRSLSGSTSGENRLYCSDGCKKACPIFNQRRWPKGFKPASSREVDPLIRQMCLKRDDYTCQKCGKTIDEVELHSHHIEGAVQQPMLANDVENTITLCKPCHILVHKQAGCTYYDLRCN